MPKYTRYQDYVIRDGHFVGEFEEMYREYPDPWEQLTHEQFASEKAVALNLLRRIGAKRVVELGSGLGQLTARIASLGIEATGLDISPTAVEKARIRHPNANFLTANISDIDVVRRLDPDAIVMAEVTWYVLPLLKDLLRGLRTALPKTRLIHLLTTYPPGVQKYGREYFTDLSGILDFFGMHYLETGSVQHPNGECRTWFLGEWPQNAGASMRQTP